MRAAVFHGAGDVRLTDVADPVPRQGEVVVRVTMAGICGSDVNRFRYGSHPWPPPFIMGHEFCGEIAGVGPDVRDWREGDQVVVRPTLSCGACVYCRGERENLCVEFARRGLTGSGTDGGFAEYVCVPAYQPHRRPPALSPDVASLVEPMAVSVHGWNLTGIERPESAVVVGLGNIGLLAVRVARAKGARRIIAVGKYPTRQALARAYGASVVLDPDDAGVVERAREATEGLGADLVVEAAGSPSSLRMAVAMAAKGGTIVVLGVMHEKIALDYRAILMNEQRILGSIIYRRPDFAEAIEILTRDGVDPRHVTETIPLEDVVRRGFVPLTERRGEHVKIQVRP
jgi:(R,R)-butanediol dehydrogenase / meso-butanediol dehydrogenase / diacetyl reductase